MKLQSITWTSPKPNHSTEQTQFRRSHGDSTKKTATTITIPTISMSNHSNVSSHLCLRLTTKSNDQGYPMTFRI